MVQLFRVVYSRTTQWIHLKSDISAMNLRINVKVGCEVTKGLRPMSERYRLEGGGVDSSGTNYPRTIIREAKFSLDPCVESLLRQKGQICNGSIAIWT